MDNALGNNKTEKSNSAADDLHVRQYKGHDSSITEGFLDALFDFYVSGYYLNLNEERYYAIGQEATYNDLYGDTNPWSVMDDYIKESIHPDDQALITEVSRIPYIRERLSREKSYSIEVRDLATGSERWYRYTTMRCADPDHAVIVFVDATDQVLARQEHEHLMDELEERQAQLEEAHSEQEAQLEEIIALNSELEERQAQLEEATAEQEAQLEEITALNSELEERQAQLEEATAEQEAQIEEITALNEELEASRDSVSEAFGMIEGLNQEYHTIWVVSKETSRMRLVRSSGKSTIQGAVQMGKDMPEFDTGFDAYIETYIEPEDRERMHRQIAFSEVLRQLEERPDQAYKVNYLRHTDDGRVGYHQIAFANADTKDGHRRFVYGFRDVDALVREERVKQEELRQARDEAEQRAVELSKQNDIVANAGLGMWHIILKDGCAPRMDANWKMLEILGIPGRTDLSEEEVYAWWWDHITPDAIPSVNASVAEMLNGKFSENTYLWEHPEKGLIYTRCGGTCVTLDDGTHVISGYHGDVTDLVYEEEQRKQELAEARDAANAASNAKSAFLFNMSHDIRTPMNAIIGFANLLEKYQEDPVRRSDYLHKIQNSSSVLLEIINNVLDMARIESGTMSLEEKPCHVGQLTAGAASVFGETMAAKGIEFTTSSDCTHEYVWCDATKVTQIINNIVCNAYKYTGPGGRVDLRLEEVPYGRDGWTSFRVTVSDTGIGMDAEFIPTIFDEFTRERTTTMSKVEGTGLGMPIVKRLVELMGGTIDVESEKGVGTTFTVAIPMRIADEAALEQTDANDQSAVDFTGRRILLAEDNDLNAEIAIEILSDVGFEVDRAEDGQICVQMLQDAEAGTYDVILMDVQMPNMNGHEATRAIRALADPVISSIAILAMTANAFEEDRRAAFEAGMDGHVAKPIDVPDLMSTLSSVLGNSAVAVPDAQKRIKTNGDSHEAKVLFKLRQSFASMVAPGGFFAYWAAQPEKLIYANDMACKIWGCEDYQEFYDHAGGSFKGLVHPDDYERAEKEIWDCINGGTDDLDRTRYRIIKKDGTVSCVEDYGRLVRDPEDGDIFYVFVSEAPNIDEG